MGNMTDDLVPKMRLNDIKAIIIECAVCRTDTILDKITIHSNNNKSARSIHGHCKKCNAHMVLSFGAQIVTAFASYIKPPDGWELYHNDPVRDAIMDKDKEEPKREDDGKR